MGNEPSKSKRSRPKKLSDEGIARLSQETQYEREKIIEMEKAFLQVYPTGRMSKQQFIKAYKSHPSLTRVYECDRYLDSLFKAFDRDNSNEIDFVEYLTVMSIQEKGTLEDKLRLFFKQFDRDNSGRIDRKEMEAMVKAIFEMNGSHRNSTRQDYAKKTQEIMEKLDKNGDRSVTIDEFVKGCIED